MRWDGVRKGMKNHGVNLFVHMGNQASHLTIVALRSLRSYSRLYCTHFTDEITKAPFEEIGWHHKVNSSRVEVWTQGFLTAEPMLSPPSQRHGGEESGLLDQAPKSRRGRVSRCSLSEVAFCCLYLSTTSPVDSFAYFPPPYDNLKFKKKYFFGKTNVYWLFTKIQISLTSTRNRKQNSTPNPTPSPEAFHFTSLSLDLLWSRRQIHRFTPIPKSLKHACGSVEPSKRRTHKNCLKFLVGKRQRPLKSKPPRVLMVVFRFNY